MLRSWGGTEDMEERPQAAPIHVPLCTVAPGLRMQPPRVWMGGGAVGLGACRAGVRLQTAELPALHRGGTRSKAGCCLGLLSVTHGAGSGAAIMETQGPWSGSRGGVGGGCSRLCCTVPRQHGDPAQMLELRDHPAPVGPRSQLALHRGSLPGGSVPHSLRRGGAVEPLCCRLSRPPLPMGGPTQPALRRGFSPCGPGLGQPEAAGRPWEGTSWARAHVAAAARPGPGGRAGAAAGAVRGPCGVGRGSVGPRYRQGALPLRPLPGGCAPPGPAPPGPSSRSR